MTDSLKNKASKATNSVLKTICKTLIVGVVIYVTAPIVLSYALDSTMESIKEWNQENICQNCK